MVNPIRLIRYMNRSPEAILAIRQTPAYWQLLSRYLEISSGDYPFEIPLKGGGSLTLGSREEVQVFWHIFVRRCYALPERCSTILDCGANVGIFSVWAARQKRDARIVALEPFPETFTALQANIQQNSLADRVECAQVGLAATVGERQMRASGESPNRKVVFEEGNDVRDDVVPISCITLAECLDRFGMNSVDLLKMDIEGSEWSVLLSTAPAVLRRIRHIDLEYHEINRRFGYQPEQLFDHLAAAGLRLTFRYEDRCHTGTAFFERCA